MHLKLPNCPTSVCFQQQYISLDNDDPYTVNTYFCDRTQYLYLRPDNSIT
jgi:hypothetical protein